MSQQMINIRCKETIRHWNEMIENLGQVVAEGGHSCDKVYDDLKKYGEILGDSIRKAYKK